MRVLNKFRVTLGILAILFLNSCFGNSSFDKNELKLVRAYTKPDTSIYISSTGKKDTILFNAAVIDTVKLRNIGQGFYNNNILRVTYSITKHSFHKVTVASINNEPEDFIAISKSKDSDTTKEISFLGLIFDEEYIKRVIELDEKDSVVFNAVNAKYKNVNIKKGIKSFSFSFNKGVLSFIDNENIKWIRVRR